jgi:hypothetical protein
MIAKTKNRRFRNNLGSAHDKMYPVPTAVPNAKFVALKGRVVKPRGTFRVIVLPLDRVKVMVPAVVALKPRPSPGVKGVPGVMAVAPS